MAEYVPGIDVSKWQGEINWETVKAQGIVWACARMGLGHTYKDGQWLNNLANARANEVVIGGYFVPDYNLRSISAHLNNFDECLEDLINQPDFLVIDVELNMAGMTQALRNELTYQLLRRATHWLGTKERVMSYTRANIYNRYMGDRFMAGANDAEDALASDYRLWIAHYNMTQGMDWHHYLNPSAMPTIPISWAPSETKPRGEHLGWKIHQVTDSALNFQGVQSAEIDINNWKADDFYSLFPGAIPGDPDPDPEPTPDPDPTPTPDPLPGEAWGVIYKV
jgi:lysozyme